MNNHNPLILAMAEHDRGNPQLIQHFLKVYQLAALIGVQEGLNEKTQHILEAAAIVHDIGILASRRVYGDDAGAHQEELGPAEAADMLRRYGYAQDVIDRVSYLVGRHHTYTDIDGMDCQILIEADFLVNLFENGAGSEAILRAQETIFRTIAGREMLKTMFGM